MRGLPPQIVVRPPADGGQNHQEARNELENWWAWMDSNHRPADYESQTKPSDPVQRRRSEYKTSTPTSRKSAVVRQDPYDWQSRLAVKILAENTDSMPGISTLAASSPARFSRVSVAL